MTKKDRSRYYVDENAVRLIAAQVVIIALLSLWQGWISLFILLSADFALRGLTHIPSPLAAVAKAVVRTLKLNRHPIFAAPKRFAATIGFVFSIAIAILFFFDCFMAAYIVGSVLVFFAILESVFKICVGCRVYDWLVAPIANKRNLETVSLGN